MTSITTTRSCLQIFGSDICNGTLTLGGVIKDQNSFNSSPQRETTNSSHKRSISQLLTSSLERNSNQRSSLNTQQLLRQLHKCLLLTPILDPQNLLGFVATSGKHVCIESLPPRHPFWCSRFQFWNSRPEKVRNLLA